MIDTRNEQPKVNTITPEQAAAMKKETLETGKMLHDWAKTQGTMILKQMELKRHASTLGIYWKQVKTGWLGGFVSGVTAGFQLGFKAQAKLSAQSLAEASAVHVDAIPVQNCLAFEAGKPCTCGNNCGQESLPV